MCRERFCMQEEDLELLVVRRPPSRRKLAVQRRLCPRRSRKTWALPARSGWEKVCLRTACSTCFSPCRARMRRKPPSIPCTASSVCRVHKCYPLGIACSRSCGVRARIFLSRHTACSNTAAFDAHKRHYRRTLCTGFVVCRAHRYRADHCSASASWRLLLVLVPSHSGSLLLPVHRNPIQHGAAAQRPGVHSDTPES